MFEKEGRAFDLIWTGTIKSHLPSSTVNARNGLINLVCTWHARASAGRVSSLNLLKTGGVDAPDTWKEITSFSCAIYLLWSEHWLHQVIPYRRLFEAPGVWPVQDCSLGIQVASVLSIANESPRCDRLIAALCTFWNWV